MALLPGDVQAAVDVVDSLRLSKRMAPGVPGPRTHPPNGEDGVGLFGRRALFKRRTNCAHASDKGADSFPAMP
jgi:hypothetical protein